MFRKKNKNDIEEKLKINKEQFLYKRRKRVIILSAMMLICFLLLASRLAYIQIKEGENYKSKLESQHIEKIKLSSERGIILDRNGEKLTDTTNQKILIVEKTKLNNNYNLLKLISDATNLTTTDIYRQISTQLSNSNLEFTIDIDFVFEKYEDELNKEGVIVENRVMRYSESGILSHIIGYVSKTDNVGMMGIEKSFDEILKDASTNYLSVFKAGNNSKQIKLMQGEMKKVSENETDKNIETTIDSKIQKIVENIANKESNPSAIIVSYSETAEILAMTSRPNFNQENVVENLNNEDGSLKNRAISATYPPGSVFKMVVLYSALENGVIDDNYTYNCTGKYVFPDGSVLNCHNKEGDGIQNLNQAFANSCNPAFYDIASKLGKEKIMETAKKLHLFEKTEIGLLEEKNSKIPEDIALRNLAIGQGNLEFTPIQINQMTQIIANNGNYVPLKLLNRIVDRDGNTIEEIEQIKNKEKTSKIEEEILEEEILEEENTEMDSKENIEKKIKIEVDNENKIEGKINNKSSDSDVSKKIKEIMKDVADYGTAKSLKDLKGIVGAKTGTAQSTKNGKAVEHGWITGYYKINGKEYIITVFVEGEDGNNKSAVPLFKEICESIQ
ncbi:MAG: penicillin-binding protein 2 [Clostridioides sp.]|nr:penicillin-binding protein 2 [Clostridioides sp.]